jgi:pyrroline-5-carboxylate reductase
MESNKIITLIGYGRLGSCLASQLIKSRAGLKYIVSPEVSNKGKFRNKLTKEIVSESDVIIICVQEKNIGTVVKNISDLKVSLNRKIIFHTSGVRTSDELKSLKDAYIGSFHPAQTFTKKSMDRNLFEGIYIALEGTKEF